MSDNLVIPEPGQIWQRRDGTRFKIEYVTGNYAYYWLATGSHPQFRSINIFRIPKDYKLVEDPSARAFGAALTTEKVQKEQIAETSEGGQTA